jgi:transposase
LRQTYSTAPLFVAYVEPVLALTLRIGDTVVMVNLASHKKPAVRQVIEAVGAERAVPAGL